MVRHGGAHDIGASERCLERGADASLETTFQISNYTWINSTHVRCSVPNDRGVARSLFVAVTTDWCAASPSVTDTCNHLSPLTADAMVTFVANTTVVTPDKGPQGSDTEIAVWGYGFSRVDRFQTLETTGGFAQAA